MTFLITTNQTASCDKFVSNTLTLLSHSSSKMLKISPYRKANMTLKDQLVNAAKETESYKSGKAHLRSFIIFYWWRISTKHASSILTSNAIRCYTWKNEGVVRSRCLKWREFIELVWLRMCINKIIRKLLIWVVLYLENFYLATDGKLILGVVPWLTINTLRQ